MTMTDETLPMITLRSDDHAYARFFGAFFYVDTSFNDDAGSMIMQMLQNHADH